MLKKIKKVAKYIKDSYSLCKENDIKFSKHNIIGYAWIGKKSIPIHHIRNLDTIGIYFAGVTWDFGYKIMVDDNYLMASKELKSFVISHECGHVANGDLSLKEVFRKLKTGFSAVTNGSIGNACDAVYMNRMYEQELAADRYAADITSVNTVISGLNELYKKTYSPEISDRIIALGGEKPKSFISSIWDDCINIVSIDEIPCDEEE